MQARLHPFTGDPAVVAILAATALLAIAAAAGQGEAGVVVVGLTTAVALAHRALLRRYRLIAALLLVVLIVPIGRYRLSSALPFDLELYRIVVAGLLLVWLLALIADPRVRLESTVFDHPLALIVACALASVVTNPSRVSDYGSNVLKSFTFFLSFVLVYYLVASTLRRRDQLIGLLKLLVVGGASLGVFAVIEQRTHYNVFDHISSVFPFLTFDGPLSYLLLGGNIRAVASSQQPIAFGAAMIMILPLAVYFARTSRPIWWLAGVMLVLGAMASGSRTAILMLVVVVVVFLVLKPRETRRLWPALIPAVVVIHFATPGTIGSFKDAFFPQGGLVAQQSQFQANYDPLFAGGRVRLLRPMLAEASQKPLFGEGLGTRLTGFNTPNRNAPILDNQWLGTVLEVGFIGAAAWLWLLASAVRRLGAVARAPMQEGDDWLFAGLTASITSLGIGMLTFDAYDFTQVAFIFWIVLGIAAGMLRLSYEPSHETEPAREVASIARRRSPSLGLHPEPR